jgi:hypothetical protein
MLVVAFVIIGFIERIFELAWFPAYLRDGIPIYRKKIFIYPITDISNCLKPLEESLKATFWHKSVEFHVLDSNLYAFRYKPLELRFFSYRHLGIMRRILWFNASTGEFEIVGFIYWSHILLLGALCFAGIDAITMGLTTSDLLLGALFFILLFALLITISYSIDSHVNDKIFFFVEEHFKNIPITTN